MSMNRLVILIIINEIWMFDFDLIWKNKSRVASRSTKKKKKDRKN